MANTVSCQDLKQLDKACRSFQLPRSK
ncbi:hypothetical protein M8C21_003839 [Ambrosia artemisiifolia]|uniref:Uncharacterized protein n=1 Tax=Ambrosia artemisiifolia TaxID=4212 RepID=A0AAD5BQA1_AMBAR|nr:hypothetical protein M8C21_003839 [Ambrosia artemisiifolia]